MDIFLILALVFALLGAISLPAGRINWHALAFVMFICSLLFAGHASDPALHRPWFHL